MLKQRTEWNKAYRIATRYFVAGALAIPLATLYAVRSYPADDKDTFAFCLTIVVAIVLGFAIPEVIRHGASLVGRLREPAFRPFPQPRTVSFDLLPQRRINLRAMATAYGLATLAVLLLLGMHLVSHDLMELPIYQVMELIPRPSLRPDSVPAEARKQDHPKLMPKVVQAREVEQARLIVPPELRRASGAHFTEPPPVVVVNKFDPQGLELAGGGSRPVLIHTGDFDPGKTEASKVGTASEKVQTGGFGDPNGLTRTGKVGARLYAAQTGSFDMPTGAGQSDGTRGSVGVKGTVGSAGFGSGIATAGKGVGRNSGQISTGGFGTETIVTSRELKLAQANPAPVTSPVEITFKPNPVYTQDARDLKLEGEVLLEVTFSANGTLHVDRVVRGLGHGLDEAAIVAANKIRFKPALSLGLPVDSTALVHVVFQLAY